MSIIDDWTEVPLEPTGNKYRDEAATFLRETNTRMYCRVAEIPYEWNKDILQGQFPRLRYMFKLVRGERSFASTFTTSINDTFEMLMGKRLPPRLVLADERELKAVTSGSSIYRFAKRIKPLNPYDLLACLQKYPVGTHAEFCAEFGCDVDSIRGTRYLDRVPRRVPSSRGTLLC